MYAKRKAFKVMSLSRDTFYRDQELVENSGIDSLINKSRRSPNPKNQIDLATEQGVFISGSEVHSIWLRNKLEKKKHDDVTCGEIETAHPGDLESQGTFHVGNLKGVGGIYQQTFIDTYHQVTLCQLSH